MSARTTSALAALALVLTGAGCGSGKSSGGNTAEGPNPNDKRGVALVCIRDEKGLPVQLTGEKSIQVDGPTGPRIEFFVSSGEAEGQQFQGKAQAAEQVGAALLFVNRGTEEQLAEIEDCLDEQ